MSDQDQDPSFAVSAPKKRTGPPVPSDTKRRKLDSDSNQDDQDIPTVPPAAPAPSITEERDPYMFYPDNYESFNPEKLVCEREPTKSRIGGGMMMFIAYIWPDGVQKPLCVQAPKMFLPDGVRSFIEEGKTTHSMLCSLGKDWESNPRSVQFRTLCDQIRRACARVCGAKKLGLPYCKTDEDILGSFGQLVFETVKYDEKDLSKPPTVFPPSIKMAVNNASNNKSRFVVRLPSDPNKRRYTDIPFSSISKGNSVIPMIQFQWIFRKKRQNPDGWAFSLRTCVFEGIIDPVSSSFPTPSTSKLSIVDMS